MVMEAVDVRVHQAGAHDATREVPHLDAFGRLCRPAAKHVVANGEVSALHGGAGQHKLVGLDSKRAHTSLLMK